MRTRTLLLFLLALAIGIPARAAGDPPIVRRYRSDFFVFLGHDARGQVIFAINVARAREAERWQAQFLPVLWDQKQGWIDLVGSGIQPNPSQAFDGLPDSTAFRCTGSKDKGLCITSAPNALVLTLEPLVLRTNSELAGELWRRNSAAAKLRWNERELSGAVIHEECLLEGRNLIEHPEAGLFGSGWNGLYAVIDGGQCLCVHKTGGPLVELLGKVAGFVLVGADCRRLDGAEFLVPGWTQAAGFFRWPTRWTIGSERAKHVLDLEVKLSERNALATWVVGGAAVAIARGSVKLDGVEHAVFGLAQIVR